MAGKWHNTVVQVLRELCDEWVSEGIYKKVADGNSDPIPISYKKQTYYYQPDLYGIYSKNDKVDIFEVIDAETEGEAVMDMVYSALTPRVNFLCMICSDQSKLEAIKQHARIILNKIFDEEKKSYSRIFRSKYFVYVPRNARSSKAIKRLLRTRLEF
jgi:uncharacterized protein YwgA